MAPNCLRVKMKQFCTFSHTFAHVLGLSPPTLCVPHNLHGRLVISTLFPWSRVQAFRELHADYREPKPLLTNNEEFAARTEHKQQFRGDFWFPVKSSHRKWHLYDRSTYPDHHDVSNVTFCDFSPPSSAEINLCDSWVQILTLLRGEKERDMMWC